MIPWERRDYVAFFGSVLGWTPTQVDAERLGDLDVIVDQWTETEKAKAEAYEKAREEASHGSK